MKKTGFIMHCMAAILCLSACSGHNSGNMLPADGIPALIEATLPSLSQFDITEGPVNVLPISASNSYGDRLDLLFYIENRVYLSEGAYTFGQSAGQYSGHFKNAQVEGDITLGNITVTVEGDEDYTLYGTVRLGDTRGSAIKIRASGKLLFNFETEYYYTVSENVKIGNNTADIYRIYSMDDSRQMAEAAICGGHDEGEFDVKDSGTDGTALIGRAHGGTWFWIDNYGTYVMLHGKVSVSKAHGKLNFSFIDHDIRSASFSNCERKDNIVPNLRKGDNPIVTDNLTARFFSVKSPLFNGVYELTAKIYYSDGSEAVSAVLFAPTENPAMEDVGKRKNFAPVKHLDEVIDTPPAGGIGYCLFDAQFYCIDGISYDIGESIAIQIVYKDKNGKQTLAVLPLLSATAMPDPLFHFLGGENPQLSGGDKPTMYVLVGNYISE